jgi:hypothetical protein
VAFSDLRIGISLANRGLAVNALAGATPGLAAAPPATGGLTSPRRCRNKAPRGIERMVGS